MFERDTCLSLLLIFSIFLNLTLQTSGAPNLSSQTTDAVGEGVASNVIEVLAALKSSQSLRSSVSYNSSYQAAKNINSSISLPITPSSDSSSVPNTGGQTVTTDVIESLAAFGSPQSLPSLGSTESNTIVNGVNSPTSSQLSQSSSVSGASITAVDLPASSIADATAMSQQSALSATSGASLGRFANPAATDSTQSVAVIIPSSVSASSVPSLSANDTLTPLPNMATVILGGTSQVLYKQTFSNLRSLTAAENITTALSQSSSQSTNNAILPVGAPVAIVVGAAGIWYRIGKTGPPIGPPDLPKLTISGGRSRFCTLFPLLCPGLKSPDLSGSGQNGPGNGPKPPTPKEDPDPESDGASQSRGEPTNMPSSQVPTTKSTYSAQSITTRSTMLTQSSSTRSTSSSQSLMSFDWYTQTISGDQVFMTTTGNFSAVSSYLQAEFTSMGIAFDQEDAMAGIAAANNTNATTTVASSAEEGTDISATAPNVADTTAAAATAAGSTDGSARSFALTTSTSPTASRDSKLTSSAAGFVIITTSAHVSEPPSHTVTQPAPTIVLATVSPLFVLACTQM